MLSTKPFVDWDQAAPRPGKQGTSATNHQKERRPSTGLGHSGRSIILSGSIFGAVGERRRLRLPGRLQGSVQAGPSIGTPTKHNGFGCPEALIGRGRNQGNPGTRNPKHATQCMFSIRSRWSRDGLCVPFPPDNESNSLCPGLCLGCAPWFMLVASNWHTPAPKETHPSAILWVEDPLCLCCAAVCYVVLCVLCCAVLRCVVCSTRI